MANPSKGSLGQNLGAFAAQFGEASSLNDGEERLRRVASRGKASLRPDVSQSHGLFRLAELRRGRKALIQDHHDVAAHGLLHFDARLGAQVNEAVIDITAKDRAFLGDGAGIWKGKNLKSSRVGEDRFSPAHEALNAAELAEDVGAGSEQEMIGVGDQNREAGCLKRIEVLAADGGVSADRHENRGLHLIMERAENTRACARAGCAGFQFKR